MLFRSVVDTDTGTLAGQITGFRFAHSIALDDTGEFGFVSDGPANQVKVFDRRTFKIVARIPTGPSPRALVFEPQTKLLFAVSADPLPQNSVPSRPAANQPVKSSITVIDAQTRAVIGNILLPGKLGFAATTAPASSSSSFRTATRSPGSTRQPSRRVCTERPAAPKQPAPWPVNPLPQNRPAPR